MHIAILTRQIGHYHDARYRASAAAMSRVTVISTANEGGFAEFLADDLGVYAVERLFPDRLAYDAAVRGGRLRGVLNTTLARIVPDALVIPGWATPESSIAISWARRRGIPLILMSETQADDAPRSIIREIIKRRIVSLCDSALVGGPTHADYLTHLGMPPHCIQLGYNAVDNHHFATGAAAARADPVALRHAKGLPERYVLASARFIAKKNLPELVKGYAKAVKAEEGPTPDLVILGDGEERDAIRAASEQSGVSGRVQLPGFRGYDVLPAYYGLAEAFAHVSTVEQWGLVVNEAMAAGLPVLVSEPCGVTRTVVEDGISGLIVRPDTEAIGKAFSRLFKMTPTDRVAMGAAASAAIADWGPDRFGSGIKAAVESARMAERRGPPGLIDRFLLFGLERARIDRVT